MATVVLLGGSGSWEEKATVTFPVGLAPPVSCLQVPSLLASRLHSWQVPSLVS